MCEPPPLFCPKSTPPTSCRALNSRLNACRREEQVLRQTQGSGADRSPVSPVCSGGRRVKKSNAGKKEQGIPAPGRRLSPRCLAAGRPLTVRRRPPTATPHSLRVFPSRVGSRHESGLTRFDTWLVTPSVRARSAGHPPSCSLCRVPRRSLPRPLGTRRGRGPWHVGPPTHRSLDFGAAQKSDRRLESAVRLVPALRCVTQPAGGREAGSGDRHAHATVGTSPSAKENLFPASPTHTSRNRRGTERKQSGVRDEIALAGTAYKRPPPRHRPDAVLRMAQATKDQE